MATEAKQTSRLRMLALATLAAFAAACGDDPTGPGSDDPFDVQQSSDEFGPMQTALTANDDLAEDLTYVSGALDTIPAAAWTIDDPAAMLGQWNAAAANGSLVEPVFASTLNSVSRVDGSLQALIPADLLGTTFEWDEVENGYVATDRTGAPANGIRFILYDRTTDPLVEYGFVDVTDESDPSADRLSVHLEKEGVTRLEYDVELVETTNGASVSVAGFVTDGSAQVDFDVAESVVQSSGGFAVDLEASMSLAGEPLSVGLVYSIDFGETIAVSLDASFVNGANTLAIHLSQAGETALEGDVEWNGELVMTVEDDGTGEPTFLGPEGEPLTAGEAQAIEEMFEIAMEGLDFLTAYLIFLGGGVA